MKISTPRRLLFTLVLSGMGFVAVGLNSSASLNQSETQAKSPDQQGYGHAPQPRSMARQARVQIQQGYGHAPQPRSMARQARVQIQHGYGHAPHTPVESMSFLRE